MTYIEECIKKYRSKLLDTSRRNNLISFRHSERSRQHIRVIDELPDFLYGQFLANKTLIFKELPEEDQVPPDEKTPEFKRRLEQAKLTDEAYIRDTDNLNEDKEGALDIIKKIERNLRDKIREELSLPSWEEQNSLTNVEIARKHDLDPGYEMPKPTPENQQNAERHIDKFIQTLLKPEEMSRKLSGLNAYIRSDIEESGVNTLYAAFGFLQWYESKNTDKPCIAPLLLLQLKIEKKQTGTGYTYRIRATGEEPEINLSISERLGKDFGINLPRFITADNSETADSPETYMDKVTELVENANNIPKKEKWRVRRFITIGRFRFARLVMWRDLDEKNWPGNTGISTNEIIKKLFTGSDNKDAGGYAEDYNIDAPEIEQKVPLLITPADASQHSALVDVMEGNNLAITGPPGTGKSQTITNIIANALHKGNTVLFLAEKMAALNVVYDRLVKANLGLYCLELHSTKAIKAEVIKSIRERLRLGSSTDNHHNLAVKLDEFKDHRDKITEYINVLNSNFGRQNKTVHDYLWAVQRRKDQLSDLLSTLREINIPFEQADLTEHELTAHTDALKIIARLKQSVEAEAHNGKHPWRFVGNISLDPFQQDELKQLVRSWKDQVEAIQETLNSLTERLNLSLEPNFARLQAFLDETETLAQWTAGDLDQALIANLDNLNKAEALTGFVERIHTYRHLLGQITTLDLPEAIPRIEEIERHIEIAKALDTDNMSALQIRAKTQALKEELKLWKENLQSLLNIGARFGISRNQGLDKIYMLVEMPDYIASVDRDYLLFRTEDIIDERNAGYLTDAADTQRRIRNRIQTQNMDFDLSVMGEPDQLFRHAAALTNAGFFAFLDSSYRQAKKLYKLASRHKQKFKAEEASEALRAIARTKQECRKIEQDTRLQVLCGASFKGMDTDFEKLQKINAWASNVRQRYVAGNEFSRRIRQWLLTADIEELDSVKDLAGDDKFIALKDRISTIKNDVSPDTPLEEYLDNLTEKAEKTDRLKTTLQTIAVSEDVTFAGITRDLPRLSHAARTKREIENNQTAEQILGDIYAGVETDIQNIEQTARFISNCLAVSIIKDNPELFFNENFDRRWREFVDLRKKLKRQYEAIKRYAEQTEIHLQISLPLTFDAENWKDISYANLIALFKNAIDKPDSLSNWIDFSTRLNAAKQDIKNILLTIYIENTLDFETLPLAFEYIIYRNIAREIYIRNQLTFASIRGADLKQARAKIRKLDEEILQLQQNELGNTLNNARPKPGKGTGPRKTWTEEALLNNEIDKERRHIPIRDLMDRAGQSIQKIKPCFLMSPLTVSQYLKPGKIDFDLVVIDEASQMRPEDALGAVARARQIVVVGDPKQLPPTSFFQSADRDDEDQEEDFTEEAIMNMALSAFRPSRILSRHYRSRHESLIEFSNYHFYDNSLILFPSPVKNPDELGVRREYVGGTYVSNSNMDEVEALVRAALDFMRKYPGRSLGIATMNQVQRDLIEMEMDRAFIEHRYADEYRTKWQNTLESFFVKNLESVQGDERDAIFISTVYGPDKNGAVMQRFGPINQQGGHRRLNVLFTRAKRNMVVFTSLKAEDIRITDNASQGLKALKKFLIYASEGRLDTGEETHRSPDSDFGNLGQRKAGKHRL